MTQIHQQSDALQAAEALSASNATHPRVSLADMTQAIAQVDYLNLGDAIERTGDSASAPSFLMTLCAITLKNGFVVLGKSAPASPENFDKTKGQTFAYEDAIRQLWPLMGFALRDRLIGGNTGTNLI